MADDQLKELFELFTRGDDPTGTVAVLIHETVRLRDALKQETGRILTVGDTRAALGALKDWLSGRPPSTELTDDQTSLLKAWRERLLH
jgi:hypothetical protein